MSSSPFFVQYDTGGFDNTDGRIFRELGPLMAMGSPDSIEQKGILRVLRVDGCGYGDVGRLHGRCRCPFKSDTIDCETARDNADGGKSMGAPSQSLAEGLAREPRAGRTRGRVRESAAHRTMSSCAS
jgi:hypothetical protein